MLTAMFETFEVQNMYIALQSFRSLYANGRTTGLAVSSGYGVTHTVPVFEGFPIRDAVGDTEISGREITNYVQNILQKSGHSFTSPAEVDIVKDIKEKLYFVAYDYIAECDESKYSSEKDQAYTLPDRSRITIKGTVCMQAPELLFKPELNREHCDSIHHPQQKGQENTEAQDNPIHGQTTKQLQLLRRRRPFQA